MKITEFRVRNFKCFQDSGTFLLAPGINILTGQNNAGKTALLQALGAEFLGSSHLSMASLPQRGPTSNLVSETIFILSISGNELLEMANNARHVPFVLPNNVQNDSGFLREHGFFAPFSADSREGQRLWQAMVSTSELQFQLARRAQVRTPAVTVAARTPSHGLFSTPPQGSHATALIRDLRENGAEMFGIGSGVFDDLAVSLWPQIQDRIYRFTAERFGLSDCLCGNDKVLRANASNLAEVLLNLRANPGSYERYIALINEILPQVKWIELEPIEGNQVRMKVWSIDKSTMREDLAMPLHECGTGIGQVLSIVYVAFTSVRPQVLLIDEPQSFLHPGAVRKLIEVLRRFPQHQYIISTHSAAVIAASGSPEILILEAKDGISTIKCESTNDTQAMQRFLEAMGARLSDVFGMDRVIWVEGATEEKAIPLLMESMNERAAGTVVVGIRNTGDLEGKDKKKAFEIYNNLTGKASMLPREIAFVLDSEARSAEARQEIIKLSGGRAHFLPRRTFENYLLHAAAVCGVANGIKGFSETGQITVQKVNECLQECLADARCWAPHAIPEHPRTDIPELHGARVLEKLFGTMSDNRVTYDKTEHSVDLFKWIVKNDRGSLVQLETFLRDVLHMGRTAP